MEQVLVLLALSFLCLVCFQPTLLAAACFAPDRAALLQLEDAFSPPDWPATTAFVGWEGDDCCSSWEGVVCESDGRPARVSKLLLPHKNLEGTIPTAICSLSALFTLDLADNSLTGSIPLCLGQDLTNLHHLNLSHNDLNGTIPASISGLLQLRSLDLGSNSFDSIASFNTPRLQWLLLSAAFLPLLNGGINIPVFTQGTPNLQHLDLSLNVGVTGGAVTNLSTFRLQQLQYLDLSGCVSLSGELPVAAFTQNFPQLRTLLLNFTPLAANASQIADLLCGLKSLEVFSMAGDDLFQSHGDAISGDFPAALSSATCKSPSVNLSLLDLSNNRITGPFPAWMSRFSSLRVLDLSHNDFSSSSIPPEWQNLTKLTSLRLTGHTTSPLPHEQMLNWLFRLPLETLTLSSLGLTNQDISCPQLSLLNATLRSLDLSHNLLIDGYALKCLLHANFTALASLDMSYNPLAFNLGSTIPSTLTEVLNLDSCQLKGELNGQLFQLSRGALAVSLAQNYFSGRLPIEIGVLSKAYTLNLSHNTFEGSLPSSLGNLTSLISLDLQNNHLEGHIPAELGNMSSLVSLFLANNHLTKGLCVHSSPQLFGGAMNFSLLGALDLSYNMLKGDLVQTFFDCQSLNTTSALSVLLLAQNELKGSLPLALDGNFPLLSVIDLSGNRLTGTIPPTLSSTFLGLTLDVSVHIGGERLAAHL